MSELTYTLHDGEAYLTELCEGEADILKIKVNGCEYGYIRFGDISIKIEGGVATLPIKKLSFGATRVELITKDGIYKLLPIKLCEGGASPVIDIRELCSIYRDILGVKTRLKEVSDTTVALEKAVFKTTIF